MNTDSCLELLSELVAARGPSGQEDEVRALAKTALQSACDEVHIDPAGNLIGLLKGRASDAPVRVVTHLDELAMIVKRIEDDGTLRVNNLGGLKPFNFGQGPVEILAGSGSLPGVLSVGPMHATKETPRSEEAKTKPLDWPLVHVFTGLSAEALREAGVRPGTRVVMARDRRRLYPVGDFISGYFMDNRAGIAAALTALAALKERGAQPPRDVYFVMAIEEEVGAIGSSYASRTLPGALTLAVDIGPVTPEYQTALTAQPIIAYRDSRALYTKAVADRLWALALEIGLEPQAATWESYGSDATIPKVYGQTAQAGLICIPGENTHGYEIIHREAIPNAARLLAAFLMSE